MFIYANRVGANPALIFHIEYKSGYRNTGLRYFRGINKGGDFNNDLILFQGTKVWHVRFTPLCIFI